MYQIYTTNTTKKCFIQIIIIRSMNIHSQIPYFNFYLRTNFFPEIQYLERAMWLHFHVTKYYDNKLIT